MAKVERFEDLICWQRARELVNMVYEITKTVPLAKDYKLRDQSEKVKPVQDKSEECRKTTLALVKHINQTLNFQPSAVR